MHGRHPTDRLKFTTRVLVLAIFVISLDFLIGITGLVSFGHAMFFGLGAYSLYFISPEAQAANALIAFPAAMLAAGAAAAIIGVFCVLTRGFYFIMVTLAFGQMLFSLFYTSRIAGGSDGAYINVKPEVVLFGATLLDFDRRTVFYYFCLAALAVVYLGMLALVRTPFGLSLQGVRDDPVRMSSLGYNVNLHRTIAFGFAAFIAAVGGLLFVWWNGHIDPASIDIGSTIDVLVIAVLGGLYRVEGAWVGALFFVILNNYTQRIGFWSLSTRFETLIGLIFLVVVLLSPGGLVGLWERATTSGRRRGPRDRNQIKTRTAEPSV